MDTPNSDISVGSRLSYNGNTCTIRFIGKIPPWDVTAYGVEWDNPEKGKHSGTLDGTKYFKCKAEGAGSFVKSTRKPDLSVSFYSALKQKYDSNDDDNDRSNSSEVLIQVSASKVIETFDKDPKYKLDDEVNGISTVSLCNLKIHDQNAPIKVSEMGINLSSLKTLDLSYNLFTSADSIANICSGLPSLRELNLSGNKITKELNCHIEVPQVRVLSLSNTDITFELLLSWGLLFPNLTQLNVSHNDLDTQFSFIFFTDLKILDLSYTNLHSLPIPQSLPPMLEAIYLSHNHIDCVKDDTDPAPRISTLDLSHNAISDWSQYYKISNAFPGLTNLRIHNNLFNAENDDAYLVEMAAWSGTNRLLKLDGVSVTEKLLEEAEKYFISMVQSKKIDFDTNTSTNTDTTTNSNTNTTMSSSKIRNSNFWKALLAKHKMTEQSNHQPKPKLNIKASILNIIVKYGDTEKKIKCLKTDTVQKLKGNVGRLFKVSSLQSHLYYYDADLQKEVTMEDGYQTLMSYGIENKSILKLVKE